MLCNKCLFCGEDRGMGWSAPYCRLIENQAQSYAACQQSEGCINRLTKEEAVEMMRKYRQENDNEK